MKRWTLRILICLILGAITTVAVGWGFAWWGRFQEIDRTSPAVLLDGWGRSRVVQRGGYNDQSGWPMKAMRFEANFAPDGLGPDAFHGGWQFQGERHHLVRDANGRLVVYPAMQALPLRPIWPAFAIDTLFYGAIWGGVFFGFTGAKRFIRARRGRCPRCGYDLRGGVMSDERLAMSEETADGVDPLSTQHSARSTSLGCPECGWNREGSDSSRRDDGM